MLKYSNFSIRTKLIMIYMVTCFLPILFISIYLTNSLARFTSENTRHLTYSSYEQLKSSMIRKISEINNCINDLSQDITIINYVNTQYENDYIALENYVNILERNIKLRINNQSRFLIYSDNPSLGISRITNNSIMDFNNMYGAPNIKVGKINWKPINDSTGTEKAISCYKAIRSINPVSDKKIVFSIESNEQILYSLFESLLDEFKIYLIDENKLVITSTDRQMIYKASQNLLNDKGAPLIDIKNGNIISIGNIRYLVFNERLVHVSSKQYADIPDWQLLYMVPYTSIQKEINKIWLTCLSIAFLCIIISFTSAIRMSKSIASRLSVLVGKFKEVRKGNFNIAAPVVERDEIGILETGTYEMVAHIDRMMKDIQQTHEKMLEQTNRAQKLQKEKNDAELNSLRSQINPHYLFNTLETIRMNLILKKDFETANIVKIFAKSFRMVIEDMNAEHTLEEEIIFVSYYLEIQKYRFKDKLEFMINIPENVKSYPVPKLIIQPLIENAMYHGIEKRLGPGRIWVSAEDSVNRIHIQVKDNGTGIAPEMLDEIKKVIDDRICNRNKNIALRNVSNRIRLLYGSKADMKIESVVDEGTIIDIYLPKEVEKDFAIEGIGSR